MHELVIFGQTASTVNPSPAPPSCQPSPDRLPTPGFETLPARYYLRLLELLAEWHPDKAASAFGSAAPLPSATDPMATISLDQAEYLSRLATQLGPADIGLRLGLALDPGSHDILGLALLQAQSVEHALQLAARYFFLLSPGFRMRYLPDPLGGSIEVTPWLAFSESSLGLHLEAVLGALYRELLQLSEWPVPASDVQVSWVRPKHAASYRRLRGWRMVFAGFRPAGFRLRLPADWLRSPRRHADPRQRADAEARCAERMRSVRRQAGLADWTRMLLREAAAALSQGELARLSGVSVRSYHRQLQREGAHFRALQSEARMQAARRALALGHSVGRVASELGYAESANFTRAFRRVFGEPPSRFKDPRKRRKYPKPGPSRPE